MKNPALDLPIHPSLTHPLTGLPLVGVGFRADGRVIWPVLGGSKDNDDKGGKDDKDDKDDKSDTDDDKGGKSDDDTGGDKGFPEATPVSEMTSEQQAAYWKHQSQRHEKRGKFLLKLTGAKDGDEAFDALKAELEELEKLRTEKLSDAEKAVESAKKAAKAEAQNEFGPKLARIAFEAALAHIEDDDERDELIDALNLTSVIKADGEIDTAKVRSIANKIAPTDKGAGTKRHDYGGGRRRGQQTTGVKAGADLFAESRNKSTTNS